MGKSRSGEPGKGGRRAVISRREVYFSGHVQGVGFRYRTREVASRFAVTGYVRNLVDGRVHLVAEGEPAELERFVEAIGSTLNDHIRDVQATEMPGTGEFTSFDIRT